MNTAATMIATMPVGFAVVDPAALLFGLFESQRGQRATGAAKAAWACRTGIPNARQQDGAR